MNQYPILIELQETQHGQMYVFFDEESVQDDSQSYVAWMCLIDPARKPKEWTLFDKDREILCRGSITTCLGVGVTYTLHKSLTRKKKPDPPKDNVLRFK